MINCFGLGHSVLSANPASRATMNRFRPFSFSGGESGMAACQQHQTINLVWLSLHQRLSGRTSSQACPNQRHGLHARHSQISDGSEHVEEQRSSGNSVV